MIQSMTGFGKAVTELPNRKITVEIKSLNSKQLDLSTRIPAIYREKEMDIRAEVGRRLERGDPDVRWRHEHGQLLPVRLGEESVRQRPDRRQERERDQHPFQLRGHHERLQWGSCKPLHGHDHASGLHPA